jgi:carbamoyltransferase
MTDMILGISAFYHDSAAALVADGGPLAAAHEERFSRRRHDPSFPKRAVEYCLNEAGAKLDDVSTIAYYENPRIKFRRLLASYAAAGPRGGATFGDALSGWLSYKLRVERSLERSLQALDLGGVPEIVCREHHESHAASAFLPSPFTSAAVLCIDAVGEWATTSLWHGEGTGLQNLAEIRFPHSLGLLYSAFTYFCGFKVDSGEYKLMGLAPYGQPKYADLIRQELIDIKPDGSFHLNVTQFEFLYGKVMTGRAFERLFGIERRRPETPLVEKYFDLAASVQHVTEEVVLKLAATARRRTSESALCLAGGVALNCVANGKILREGIFDDVWIQPAAGDAGGALGAAMAVAAERGARRKHLGSGRDAMAGALLGPSYSDEQIGHFLEHHGVPHVRMRPDDLARTVARHIADGKVVGWFQGRMEYGPRALGARSILGDPRDASTQTTMNLKIKFRESFRPFAPSVLAEDAGEYFELDHASPYMLLVADVSKDKRLPTTEPTFEGLDLLRVPRSTIPAVTHVDFSARLQTVAEADNPTYYRLISEFKQLTGCPVVVNTSFNVRGEPIVNRPEEAYTCFMRTNMDYLAIGGFLLDKASQPQFNEADEWRTQIPLD